MRLRAHRPESRAIRSFVVQHTHTHTHFANETKLSVRSEMLHRQWNSLPHHITDNLDSLNCFKSALKTHLYIKMFN